MPTGVYAVNMQADLETFALPDEQIVAAVRRGDAERYRELVERHERRVFAVAWSRLGDPDLAEEVTQEAFIRGYRHLRWLGEGAKFASWITSIARNVAINFGLRHRRELNKRQRWALEQVTTSTEVQDYETEGLCPPETLRQTLAELPAAHRECLVLFYLEGKSGAEAAATLGISEPSFRVRLHRSRAALREQLERKLEGALEKLRPAATLVPAVMAAILVPSSAKAATAGGVGATIGGALVKLTPLKWGISLLPLLFALPMLLVSWLRIQGELANFRDTEGFRARLFRTVAFRGLIWMPVIIVVAVCLMPIRKVGQGNFFLILSVFCLPPWLIVWRQLVLNRSRYFIVMFLSSGVLLTGFLLLGFHVLPFSAFNIFLGAQVLMTTLIYGERPARMDYNLFLRAAEGLLDCTAPKPSPTARQTRLRKHDLLAFGRFLGSRWLVDSYRWTSEGLRLRLPAFHFSLWNSLGFLTPWSHRSRLVLAWDGKVSAHLCSQDSQSLRRLHPIHTPTMGGLESRVTAAVETAWGHFTSGHGALAERALGQVPEQEIFVDAPSRSGWAHRRTRWALVLLAALVAGTGLLSLRPAWMDGLKAVAATEEQVRSFLNDSTPNPVPKRYKFNSPGLALFDSLVLPPTNLFSPDGLKAMRDTVAGGEGFDGLMGGSRSVGWIFNAPLARRAITGGWISWSDLEATPDDAATFLRTSRFPWYSPDKWDHLLTRCQAWSWVKKERFIALRMQSDGLTQLRLLRAVNCLDLVNREKLIQHIASVQVLSGTPPNQPPMHDWRDVRGLFFTPCFPALQDTYFSLAALEILGGLDQIDSEACIRGILSRHRGKGYFTSPDSGGYNEYHIDGSARDTFAAFESLRILGALDRVEDLDRWQFRLKSRYSSQTNTNGVRTLTWDGVEAWVCQKRLERILRDRKEKSEAPVRSLLEP